MSDTERVRLPLVTGTVTAVVLAGLTYRIVFGAAGGLLARAVAT